MLLIKNTLGIAIPLMAIPIYLFTSYTDRNINPVSVGLNQLESSREGLYKVSAKLTDIDESSITLNNGDISIKVFGNVTDKKVSELYSESVSTKKKSITGDFTIRKSNGIYNFVRMNKTESDLYLDSNHVPEKTLLINTKGTVAVLK